MPPPLVPTPRQALRSRPPARRPRPLRQTAAGTVQLAIGLLTASLDSPELLAWAAGTLVAARPGGPR